MSANNIFRCETCAWFQRGDYRTYNHAQGYMPGTCNIRAPGPDGFPFVRSTDNCGEHSRMNDRPTTPTPDEGASDA